MKPTYTYFDPEKITPPNESVTLALSVIERHKLIIDSAYLTAIEAAHQGDVLAICEMASLFGSGAPGLPKNYSQARFYIDVMKDYNKGCPKTEVEALYNSGCLELKFGNEKSAKDEFTKAAQIMVNNLPAEDWNFDVFYDLQQVTFPISDNGGEE